ncbi:MAG TPA: GTP-binding protein [Pirellulales bacterium]|jgi:Ni2+-binding GTPase involved in maturation of urease and hydrogenase|nr:GTP-binding protein [Pirellulales bacterium]
MSKTRFIMLGGFLGAGKTTAIARLAKHYQSQGLKIGIVTNDQATDLVDTHHLRSQGFEVGEVPGSCFCCNFNALTSTVEKLAADQWPDIVLAEPVGSCTDLVATVIRPLQQIYPRPVEVAPYGVLLKPSHGAKILRNEPNAGFSPKAAYIFRKQLEEADFIVINRVDTLPPGEIDALLQMLNEQFPGIPVLKMSAKTGAGFDAFVEFLAQDGLFGKRLMDVDYDVYAEGEAELGWLNSSFKVTSEKPISLDALLLDIVIRLQTSFKIRHAETAHLKTIGLWEGAFGVANLVSSESQPELSLESNCQIREADLIVNARVAIDPETLTALVEDAIQKACTAQGACTGALHTQSFRPGRPVPTHRILEPTT